MTDRRTPGRMPYDREDLLDRGRFNLKEERSAASLPLSELERLVKDREAVRTELERLIEQDG